MRIRVIAQNPSDFARWSGQQLATPSAPTAGPALIGAQFFQEFSCASCNSIRGTVTHGMTGPDLTHVASRETLAAGRLQNTPANLAQWLLEPDLVKPGCHMPNLHLTRQQQDSLVAYLESLQ